MKNHFNKELVKTKEANENFESSRKCCICDNTFVAGEVKVSDYCHVTSAAHRDCNINVNLNQKILIVFHDLKYYDAHLSSKNLANSILKKMS